RASWIGSVPEEVRAHLMIEIGLQVSRKSLREVLQRQGVSAFVVRHSEPYCGPALDPVEHSVPGQGSIPVHLLGPFNCAAQEHFAEGGEHLVVDLLRGYAAQTAKPGKFTELSAVISIWNAGDQTAPLRQQSSSRSAAHRARAGDRQRSVKERLDIAPASFAE